MRHTEFFKYFWKFFWLSNSNPPAVKNPFFSWPYLISCLSKLHSFFIVVSQPFEADVFKESVILGNDALMKCVIPSFVTDLVSVDSWLDGTGSEFRIGTWYSGKTRFRFWFYFRRFFPYPTILYRRLTILSQFPLAWSFLIFAFSPTFLWTLKMNFLKFIGLNGMIIQA